MIDKREIIVGLIIFFINLVWAVGQQWSVTDMLWSLWISSLVLGYGYIFISIFASFFSVNRSTLLKDENRRTDVLAPGVVFNLMLFLMIFFSSGFSWYSFIMFIILISSVAVSLSEETKKKLRMEFIPHFPLLVVLFLLSVPISLFMLVFFTIHFVGFHFAHSMILNEYYPLVEHVETEDPFSGFVAYMKNILHITVSRYWVFIGFSALSRLKLYGIASEAGRGSFFMPYKNVIRMHFTIILIVIMDVLRLSHFLLYVVFIIYFLPAGDLIRLVIPKKKSEQPSHQKIILKNITESIVHAVQKKMK